jgi:hypothetical protein
MAVRPDPLFVTDAEIANRVGIAANAFKTVLTALEKAGFPRPDPLFCGRRYWPACKRFLDRRYNLDTSSMPGIPALDGEEKW